MKFVNLRLVGFKSFVDATDFEILDGLTGVVGPNGCGKSNLLEAMRWAMGATSAKALRSGAMADVIFAGTSMRPSRNWAEVTLTLDNSTRDAPAEFNDAETIEVSRRIVKQADGASSIFRVNGREARAKDVQLLFADAATGANSPALVRQGQISELINAKPQNRRRLLEDAAGVTGLHSRRHEAELRLRAAGQNLERLDDVAGELDAQKASLARQARQATRYRNLSSDIRRAEAGVAYLRWRAASADAARVAEALAAASETIEETARAAALASTAQAEANAAIEPLRAAEAEAGAALHRLRVAQDGLEAEAARADADLQRLDDEAERLSADLARESELRAEAANAVDALSREIDGLRARDASERQRIADAEARSEAAASALGEAEERADRLAAEHAEAEGARRAAVAAIETANRRADKLAKDRAGLEEERARIDPGAEATSALAAFRDAAAASAQEAADADAALERADAARASADDAEKEARQPYEAAARTARELAAERDALRRILGDASASGSVEGSPLLHAVAAAPGYEYALAAAFSDDLDATLDDDDAARWSRLGATDAPSAFDFSAIADAEPLSSYVRAPDAAHRRLRATAVVDRADGEALARLLSPGQRLVSREGDLWRWDGFVRRADAKSAAAVRLEQKNRLSKLNGDVEAADRAAADAKTRLDALSAEAATAAETVRAARLASAAARRAADQSREERDAAERSYARATDRLAAIVDALERLDAEETAAASELRALREADAQRPDAAALVSELANAREALNQRRAIAGETRAAALDLKRDAEQRAARLDDAATEIGAWRTRGETAERRARDMEARRGDIETARAAAAEAPEAIRRKALDLAESLDAAEARRNDAAEALATATRRLEDCDREAKAANAAAGGAREAAARLDAEAEAAAARVDEATALARETCDAAPDELPAIAEFKDAENPPPREDVERKLERYRRERETLGGVNLRADEELAEIEARREEIATEREDCEAAIRKLRASIGSLNREARERLTAAFDTVNRNFASLFSRLFNGGEAQLRLIDSDDVLDAGLEIFASPPGKKLASMSLMSGGEQALTACALIFAVFMANPAPVCVLDEVDAPLDDTNVERFCGLLRLMAQETGTRFIVITHHALTMSRMDRLFGVTMVERGVSQLVSVDLNRAETLIAAE